MRTALLATAALFFATAALYAVESAKPATRPTTNPLAQLNDELLTRHLMNSTGAEDDATRATRRIDACMARASDRLARENDPGRTTQQIQDQIIRDIDELIELARKQPDCPPSTRPASRPSEGTGRPPEMTGARPDNQDASAGARQPGPPHPNRADRAADVSRMMGGAGGESGTDIRRLAPDWLRIPGHIRGDIIQSIGDDVVEKYHKLTADYYRAIANKASERQ